MLLALDIPESLLKPFREKNILIKECKPIINKDDLRSYSGIKKEWLIKIIQKLRIFEKDMKQWKNIVFLDSDIIVNASLNNLRNVDGIYAVRDSLPTLRKQLKNKPKIGYNKLMGKYNPNKIAFNSGVLAFSTDIIKEETFEEMIDFFGEYKENYTGDQTLINFYFYGRINELPLVYNASPYGIKYFRFTKKNDKRMKAIVWHFYGQRKPWDLKWSVYYRIWRNNLEKFNFIGLSREEKHVWSKKEIMDYSMELKRIMGKNKIMIKLDSYVGLLGIALRKLFGNY